MRWVDLTWIDLPTRWDTRRAMLHLYSGIGKEGADRGFGKEGADSSKLALVGTTHGRDARRTQWVVRSNNNQQGSRGKHEGVPKGSLNPTEKKRGKQKKVRLPVSNHLQEKRNPLLNRFHTSNIRIIYDVP